MLYCEKCRRLCPDSAARCPACRSQKLRPAGEEDLAFLCECGLYHGERLSAALEQAGILHSLEDAGNPNAYFSFDSEAMPTDKRVYVPAGQMEAAREVSVQVSGEIEEEREEAAEAEPPSWKRLVGEVLSVVGFLVLVMVAVYGADGLANWLKGVLGIG